MEEGSTQTNVIVGDDADTDKPKKEYVGLEVVLSKEEMLAWCVRLMRLTFSPFADFHCTQASPRPPLHPPLPSIPPHTRHRLHSTCSCRPRTKGGACAKGRRRSLARLPLGREREALIACTEGWRGCGADGNGRGARSRHCACARVGCARADRADFTPPFRHRVCHSRHFPRTPLRVPPPRVHLSPSSCFPPSARLTNPAQRRPSSVPPLPLHHRMPLLSLRLRIGRPRHVPSLRPPLPRAGSDGVARGAKGCLSGL